MQYLFVHQNFPGQFKHVTRALATNPNNRVVGMGESRNIGTRATPHPAIFLAHYTCPTESNSKTHHYVRSLEQHVRRGQSVYRSAQALQKKGFNPDVVVAHSGWGESLFLKDLFPNARHIYYFEHNYRGTGADVGFDPEFPSSVDDLLRLRILNSTQLISLAACDGGLSPTQWQRSGFPAPLHEKIRVIHEGIDTLSLRPDPQACLQIGTQVYKTGDEVVTFVARNLEPYRGFHTFMRALPRLLARSPRTRVLILGGNGVSYGKKLPSGQTYRQIYSEELGDTIDWSRVTFAGTLPPTEYVKALQISSAHVYLTYPFVLSWSMLEAMSTGCALVASATAPVKEIINHADNGLLVDFFDPNALADTLLHILHNPQQYAAMRARARQTIVDRYDLHNHCLPALVQYLHGAAQPPLCDATGL
jgi:glycosyltransferase involved in cell wall biosynthesis